MNLPPQTTPRTSGDSDGDKKKPATSSTAAAATSNGSSASLAKKRLLPMELRRKRRAAKLLGTTSAAAASVVNEPYDVEQQPADLGVMVPAPQEKQAEQDPAATSSVPRKRSASSEPKAVASVCGDLTAEKPDDSATAVAPLSRSTSAVSRLNAFYNWSAVDRKRQRLQNRTLADVPTKFHTALLPLDMTPKAKVTLLTAFPLPFLRLSAATKRKSIRTFAGDPTELDATQPNDLRWHRALRYFAHPAASLPASITLNRMAAATKKDAATTELIKDELEFYAARLRQWQEALRDVYFSFRGQQSSSDGRSAFYVRAGDFVVCFYEERPSTSSSRKTKHVDRGPGLLDMCMRLRDQTRAPAPSDEATSVTRATSRKTKLCAVMSQSTARIRKALHHLNVAYATPYSSSTQHDIGRFHLLEAELVAMESQAAQISAAGARTATAPQNVHGADSLLYFSGHQAIHGLYEFLVNRKPLTKEDVPEIYALHPFANAAIKSLDVTYMGSVAAGLTAGSESSAAANTLFRTEISGFCFPSAVRAIIEILADEYAKQRSEQPDHPTTRAHPGAREAVAADESQAASSAVGVRAYMQPTALTERFNALHLSPPVIRRKSVSGTTLEERERWKQELELSKRRVENVVVRDAPDEDDVFEVETTARASA